jgi:protoheme IX farnesyltransferase
MKMLPVTDPSGTSAARLSVVSAIALLAVSLLPGLWQADSGLYMAGALILGAAYLLAAVRFGHARDDRTARGLLRTSLVYLPSVLGLLTAAMLI